MPLSKALYHTCFICGQRCNCWFCRWFQTLNLSFTLTFYINARKLQYWACFSVTHPSLCLGTTIRQLVYLIFLLTWATMQPQIREAAYSNMKIRGKRNDAYVISEISHYCTSNTFNNKENDTVACGSHKDHWNSKWVSKRCCTEPSCVSGWISLPPTEYPCRLSCITNFYLTVGVSEVTTIIFTCISRQLAWAI